MKFKIVLEFWHEVGTNVHRIQQLVACRFLLKEFKLHCSSVVYNQCRSESFGIRFESYVNCPLTDIASHVDTINLMRDASLLNKQRIVERKTLTGASNFNSMLSWRAKGKGTLVWPVVLIVAVIRCLVTSCSMGQNATHWSGKSWYVLALSTASWHWMSNWNRWERLKCSCIVAARDNSLDTC